MKEWSRPIFSYRTGKQHHKISSKSLTKKVWKNAPNPNWDIPTYDNPQSLIHCTILHYTWIKRRNSIIPESSKYRGYFGEISGAFLIGKCSIFASELMGRVDVILYGLFFSLFCNCHLLRDVKIHLSICDRLTNSITKWIAMWTADQFWWWRTGQCQWLMWVWLIRFINCKACN